MATKKKFKTTIPKQITKFADEYFGIEFRVGKNPRSVGIERDDIKPDLAYFGEGVVFVRDHTPLPPEDLDLALLHEVGHAILKFFPLKITNLQHEIKANAIMLAFAALMKASVSDETIQDMNALCKRKKAS